MVDQRGDKNKFMSKNYVDPLPGIFNFDPNLWISSTGETDAVSRRRMKTSFRGVRGKN